MLRTVKNLILTYALCIQNVSIISEAKTVNKIQRAFLFTGLLISKSPGSLQQNSKNWVRKSCRQEVNFTQDLEKKVKSEKAERREEGFLSGVENTHYQRHRPEWSWCVWETRSLTSTEQKEWATEHRKWSQISGVGRLDRALKWGRRG